MNPKNYFQVVLLAVLLAACAPATPAASPTPSGPRRLNIMTHDSFAISEALVAAFQDQYQVEVRFLALGDTGSAVNKAVLAKNAPLADVFYGVDNTFLSRALEEGIFEAYESPLLANIPPEFQLDPQHRALPVDYGDVCLNYEIAYFAERGLTPPQTLEDLLKPEYKGLLVVEHPATSSPGLAFLFATVSRFGDPGYLEYWQGLAENELKVVSDWDTAYYGEFTQWGGQYPLVVSYNSSPPFELIYADPPLESPPTAAVTGAGSCYRQIEFAGILVGTKNRDLAEKFIDFLLSPAFQGEMPLQMAVFPVNPQAQIDETFTQFLAPPENPATLDPTLIAEKREDWINAWTEVVLR